MKRLPARAILDLMTAAGPRRGDDYLLGLLSDGWKEHQLADLHRQLVMFLLVAERSSHATASGRNDVNLIVPHAGQYLLRVG